MASDLVPVSEYGILRPDDNALDRIRENLDGESLSEFDLPRAKMPAGGGLAWSVPTLDGDEPTKTIEGIVVFSKFSRSYWEAEFSGGNEPPDCSSPDAKVATPAEGVEIPAPDLPNGKKACDGCAYAEWGSGKGRGQACKLTRQLFVVGPERMLPLVVSLPPTSIKTAKTYFLQLADYGLDSKSLVTKIGLEKVAGQGVPDYSRATFAAGEKLDPAQAKIIAEYANALRPYFEAVSVEDRSEIDSSEV